MNICGIFWKLKPRSLWGTGTVTKCSCIDVGKEALNLKGFYLVDVKKSPGKRNNRIQSVLESTCRQFTDDMQEVEEFPPNNHSPFPGSINTCNSLYYFCKHFILSSKLPIPVFSSLRSWFLDLLILVLLAILSPDQKALSCRS